MSDDDFDDIGGDKGRVVRKGILREIWKPGDDLRNPATVERTVKRRAIRERRKAFLEDWRASRRPWDGGSDQIRRADLEAVTRPVKCANCGNWFPAANSRTRTCSPRCRVALHRKRKYHQ